MVSMATLGVNLAAALMSLSSLAEAYANSQRGVTPLTRYLRESKSYKTYLKVMIGCITTVAGSVYACFDTHPELMWCTIPNVIIAIVAFILLLKSNKNPQRVEDAKTVINKAKFMGEHNTDKQQSILVGRDNEFMYYAKCYGLNTVKMSKEDIVQLVISYTPQSILNRYPTGMSDEDKVLHIMKEACNAKV